MAGNLHHEAAPDLPVDRQAAAARYRIANALFEREAARKEIIERKAVVLTTAFGFLMSAALLQADNLKDAAARIRAAYPAGEPIVMASLLAVALITAILLLCLFQATRTRKWHLGFPADVKQFVFDENLAAEDRLYNSFAIVLLDGQRRNYLTNEIKSKWLAWAICHFLTLCGLALAIALFIALDRI